MKRLWWSAIVLALCVIGVGFYRGWFTLSESRPDVGSHKVNINLAVDPDKIKDDGAKLKEKTKELTGHVRE